jgi:hypothetical protein
MLRQDILKTSQHTFNEYTHRQFVGECMFVIGLIIRLSGLSLLLFSLSYPSPGIISACRSSRLSEFIAQIQLFMAQLLGF